jgi:hypothetical protein
MQIVLKIAAYAKKFVISHTHTPRNDQNTLTIVNYRPLQREILNRELQLTAVESIEDHFQMCDSSL